MLLQLTWNLLQEVKHLNIRDFCCIYKYTWCVSIVTTFLKCDVYTCTCVCAGYKVVAEDKVGNLPEL